MAFFRRQEIGRIYVIKMVLPGNQVIHKIGITNSNRATDRMMEILRSWFSKYRFVPYSELKLDMECGHPRLLESHIHKILERKQFIPNETVSGGTEMFIDIDEFRVLQYLRKFNDRNFDESLNLSDDDHQALCRLISP
jgi:hypothetical protein